MTTSHPITILGKPDQDEYAIVSANERQNQIKIIVRKEVGISVYVIDKSGKKGKSFSS